MIRKFIVGFDDDVRTALKIKAARENKTMKSIVEESVAAAVRGVK